MKHSQNTNWRVVVPVFEPYWMVKRDRIARERELRNSAEAIAAQVRRHVDDGEGAVVDCDVEFSCSHCGSPWTEDGNDYNGGCCGEDEKNNPNPETT